MKNIQKIKFNINKIPYTIEYMVDRTFVSYSVSRKRKTIKVSSYPKDMRHDVKMDIVKDITEQCFYEIRHELDQLKP